MISTMRFLGTGALVTLACSSPVLAQSSLVGTSGALYELSTGTGEATRISGGGLSGGEFVPDGMAFDADANTIYGISSSDQLITIDPSTAATTVIGPVGFVSMKALAFDPSSKTLFATSQDGFGQVLIAIDAETGHGTAVGPLGLAIYANVRGMALDSNTGILYGSDTYHDELVTIDMATGAGTVVGPLQFQRVDGLAFDAATNTLLGTDSGLGGSNQLISILNL